MNPITALVKKRENRMLLLLFVICWVVFIIFTFEMVTWEEDFFTFLPTDTLGDLIIISWGIPIFICLIGGILLPILVKLIISIHFRVFTRREKELTHGFYPLNPDKSTKSVLRQTLMPALLCFNLAFYLTDTTVESEGLGWLFSFESDFATIAPIAFLFLIWPLAVIFFPPLWVLNESGLVMIKSSSNSSEIPEIKGVGGFYTAFLEGYVGISTVFTIILFLYSEIDWIIESETWGWDEAIFLITLIVVFLFILVSFIPLRLYYDELQGKFQEIIRNQAVKYQIKEKITIQFKKEPLPPLNLKSITPPNA